MAALRCRKVMASDSNSPASLDTEGAWSLLLALAERAKHGRAVSERLPLGFAEGEPALDASADVVLHVDPEAPRLWSWAQGHGQEEPAVAAMLDLYMPLCVGDAANDLVVGHLGQSLDGRIATRTGASQFITGDENLVHAHRMRALFDAVLVGAHTAAHDNPRLTTRLATGEHATRVLVDPSCSLGPDAGIFTDGQSETLVLCDRSATPQSSESKHIGLPTKDGLMRCSDILEALANEGLRRVFVEGGGLTISQFLLDRALHRLQVCVAPMIIGSGRPAFALPEIDDLQDGIFLDVQHFASGKDVLFDCQLRDSE